MSNTVGDGSDLVWTLDHIRARRRWKIPETRLSPDDFHFCVVGNKLYHLLLTMGPFVRCKGSGEAVAYLHSAEGELEWLVTTKDAEETLQMPGAYACVRVSMDAGHRFFGEAFEIERKLKGVRKTSSLDRYEMERAEWSAYREFVRTEMDGWLIGARVDALRWRPAAIELEFARSAGTG